MLLWQVLLLWRKLREEDINELKNLPNRVHHKLRWQGETRQTPFLLLWKKIRVIRLVSSS